MVSGFLRESVTFDQPTFDSDGVQTGWSVSVYACRAGFRYLRGSEAVMAARLDGRQPIVATIRRSPAADTIAPDWVMKDARRGTTYNIRTVILSDDRRWIEITAESGVAT